jgi:hypothetical protein
LRCFLHFPAAHSEHTCVYVLVLRVLQAPMVLMALTALMALMAP